MYDTAGVGGFRSLRGASYFARGGKVTKTPLRRGGFRFPPPLRTPPLKTTKKGLRPYFDLPREREDDTPAFPWGRFPLSGGNVPKGQKG